MRDLIVHIGSFFVTAASYKMFANHDCHKAVCLTEINQLKNCQVFIFSITKLIQNNGNNNPFQHSLPIKWYNVLFRALCTIHLKPQSLKLIEALFKIEISELVIKKHNDLESQFLPINNWQEGICTIDVMV